MGAATKETELSEPSAMTPVLGIVGTLLMLGFARMEVAEMIEEVEEVEEDRHGHFVDR